MRLGFCRWQKETALKIERKERAVRAATERLISATAGSRPVPSLNFDEACEAALSSLASQMEESSAVLSGAPKEIHRMTAKNDQEVSSEVAIPWMRQLSRIKPERFELTGPFGRGITKALDTDTAG